MRPAPAAGQQAHLQRALGLGLLALAMACGALLWRAGHPVLAVGSVLLLLAANAVVLGLEFLLHPRFNRDDPAPSASADQLWSAWVQEARHSTLAFGWQQPWRSQAVPDLLPQPGPPPGRPGVLLVHGFMCNRGLWNPVLSALRSRGVPFRAVNLEPVFASIDEYADVIDEAVRALTVACGAPPLVVAHSMGGLAVRAWMRSCHRRGDRPVARVRHVVTIGTPHHGTRLAAYALPPNAVQMRLGSAWLAELASDEPAEDRASFTCVYSHCDNIVVPVSNACLEGAACVHVPGRPHLALALDPAVWRLIHDRLDARVDNAPHA